MKRLVLLVVTLLVAGCGEKSSSEGSESASESATPPSEDVKPSADSPKPLISDVDVERLLKEAVDMESLEERDDLAYQDNKPYSGWAKMIHDSGQVQALSQFKDGKPDGLFTVWADNGQKVKEGILKDGKPGGPYTEWHENGQKATEVTFKDGEEVSTKHWNSKGEEVETAAEAFE